VEEQTPSRTPEQSDLVKLCAALNAQGASYIVVGGMAVIQQGFLRATEDIDLLLESSRQNQARVRKALEILPDQAIREMSEDDLDAYHVVRVADEIVVDLMLSACGIAYADAVAEVESVVIQGVPIPFASAKLLLRTKETYRDKDIPDRIFREQKLGQTR
jgi:hypothetical protein